MKTLNFNLILLCALLFFQCKEKTDENSISNTEPEVELKDPEQGGKIMVKVKQYDGMRGIGDVDIEILQDSVTIGRDTTDLRGDATLTNVETVNEYLFLKEGYTSQSIRFIDFYEINEMNVYLKPSSGTPSSTQNVSGTVYDSARNPVDNVTVASDGRTVQSQNGGKYSLDIVSRDGTFPIHYYQDDVNAALRMKVDEDTVLVDVFIDGFSNDSIFVKKDK